MGYGVCMVRGEVGAQGENQEVGVRLIFSWLYCVTEIIAQIRKRTFLIWRAMIWKSREAPHPRYLSHVELSSHEL